MGRALRTRPEVQALADSKRKHCVYRPPYATRVQPKNYPRQFARRSSPPQSKRWLIERGNTASTASLRFARSLLKLSSTVSKTQLTPLRFARTLNPIETPPHHTTSKT